LTHLWLTVDDAADVLGVSSTTVRRRIKADKLDSRLNDEGVTEVWVETDDEDAESSADPSAELRARQQSENSEDQLRANPWVRAARPGDALLADRRGDDERKANSSRNAPPDQTDDEPATQSTSARRDDVEDNDPAADDLREQLKDAGRDFRPADVEPGNNADPLARFQKLAGASVLLAQRQADDAREQVAHARHESFRLRRLCYASWIGSAALLLITFGLCLYLGYAAADANARADAAEQAVARQRLQNDARAQATLSRLQNDPDEDQAQSEPDEDSRSVSADRFNANTTADVRRTPFE